MNHFSFESALIGILPAVALCAHVFFKDKAEKEPLGLLCALFGLGAVAFVPSIFCEQLILNLVHGWFEPYFTLSSEGLKTFTSPSAEILYLSLCAFSGFAIIRICLQWTALILVTRKSKSFNYLFDGVVYSVFVSLGFAVSENVYFLMQNDFDLLLPKLITSLSCQMLVGVVMGYFYTMWNMRFTANRIESKLIKIGLVKSDNIKSSAPWLIASISLPILISGIYALAGAKETDAVSMLFYFLVFFVFGISFASIRQMASLDGKNTRYLYRLIAKGHPELTPAQIQQAVEAEADGDALTEAEVSKTESTEPANAKIEEADN